MVLSGETFEAIVRTLNPKRSASVSNPPAAGTQEADGGQRRSPRVPLATRMTLVPFADRAQLFGGYDFPTGADGMIDMPLGDPVSAPVRDLSRGGIRFMMPRRLPLDTPFLLVLPFLEPPKLSLVNAKSLSVVRDPASEDQVVRPTVVECSVTHWQPVQRELFGIGAQFVRLLDNVRLPQTSPTLLLPGFGSLAATEVAGLRRAV